MPKGLFGWGTEVLLMATSDYLRIIQEPQTAVSPSFGLISVAYFGGEFR